MDSWGLEAMLAPWNGCGYCPRENPPDDRAPWRGRDVIKLPPVSSEDLDVLVAKGRRE
jgi:hypothetical protein